MFEEISVAIYNFLSQNTVFRNTMLRDGNIELYPLMAPESTDFPLTTYAIGEVTPVTKDINDGTVDIAFWFGNSAANYLECCQFTDAMINEIIENSDFYFKSAVIEFNLDFMSYSGTITISRT